MLRRFLLAPVICFLITGSICIVPVTAYARPVDHKASPEQIIKDKVSQHQEAYKKQTAPAEKKSPAVKKAGKKRSAAKHALRKHPSTHKVTQKHSRKSVATAKHKHKKASIAKHGKKPARHHYAKVSKTGTPIEEPFSVEPLNREPLDFWLVKDASERFRMERADHSIDGLTFRILESAYSYLGTPYRFGGTSPDGFDCSGFVRQVFNENGIFLGRSSRDQAREGIPVALSELKPGDLIFFNMRARNRHRIDHVGLYIGNGQFIHASSSRSKEITIDALESHLYLRKFVGARRILADSGNTKAAIE